MRRHHQRKRQATRLGLEMLEPRTLLASLAGDPTRPFDPLQIEVQTPPAASDVSPAAQAALAELAEPKVALTLEITTPDGAPLTTLSAGQTFVLHVYAQDVRSDPQGVFAAYLDVRWNASLAKLAGPLRYASALSFGKSGNPLTPGLLDEAGAFSNSFGILGGGRIELFSVPMRALAEGALHFTTDAAENVPSNDVLLYGVNGPVDAASIAYGTADLVVTPATADVPPEDWVIREEPLISPGIVVPSEPLPADVLANFKVAMTLQLTTPEGSPLTSLRSGQEVSSVRVGEEFELRALLIFVGSQSPTAFAGFADVTFNGALVAPQGDSPAIGGQFGQARAGQLDEMGRLMWDLRSDTGSILFRKNSVATASGAVEFAADPADDMGNDFLLLGQNEKLPLDRIAFGRVRLNVQP